ncbi:hypothetical protein DFS34DRAFT_644646 [Phlyctochytrium arcticum]|nr:hypothetical protein DFS34DRAFT_644646 [Phlyctochytrium arcticum]
MKSCLKKAATQPAKTTANGPGQVKDKRKASDDIDEIFGKKKKLGSEIDDIFSGKKSEGLQQTELALPKENKKKAKKKAKAGQKEDEGKLEKSSKPSPKSENPLSQGASSSDDEADDADEADDHDEEVFENLTDENEIKLLVKNARAERPKVQVETVELVDPTKKRPFFVPVDNDGFGDSRGMVAKRRTDDGYKLFTTEELGIGKGADTPQCPFQCWCCY